MSMSSWMLWWSEQHYPSSLSLRERFTEIRQQFTVRHAERREWANAGTLAELGEVTARWAEGRIKYHPGGYDRGPAEETQRLIPALVALNRSGFVTYSSQPAVGPMWGFNGQVWQQRAAVDGLCDTETADRIETACATAGLKVIRNGPAGWRTRYDRTEICTAARPRSEAGYDFNDGEPYDAHTSFGAHLSRREMRFIFDGYCADEVCDAEQVTIIDPVWGRNALLWSTVTGHEPPVTETRYSVDVLGPDGSQCETHSRATFDQVEQLYTDYRSEGYRVRIVDWYDEDSVRGYDCDRGWVDTGGVHHGCSNRASVEVGNEYVCVDCADGPLDSLDLFRPDTSKPYFLDLINRIDRSVGDERRRVEEWMVCPECRGDGCETCGGDGRVPSWLKDPRITGEDAARSWGWVGQEQPQQHEKALTAALARDDEAEERGMHADNRETCHQCQDWADHAHDWLTNARITLEEYRLTEHHTDPTGASGVMHGDGWEMTNDQYDRWHRGFFEPPEDDQHGGKVMTAPTNTGGDVVSIADLRDIYSRTAPAMAGVQEQQAAAAAGFREQATAYEAAVGGLTSEGHDTQTVAEASAAMEAMHEAARASEEAAAAADAAQAAITAALDGLQRHQALEEAVGSHVGPATRTDAYAPR